MFGIAKTKWCAVVLALVHIHDVCVYIGVRDCSAILSSAKKTSLSCPVFYLVTSMTQLPRMTACQYTLQPCFTVKNDHLLLLLLLLYGIASSFNILMTMIVRGGQRQLRSVLLKNDALPKKLPTTRWCLFFSLTS